MKFIDAKCPNCGGQVKLIPGNMMGKCENCGAELAVSTEVTDRITRSFDLISQKKYISAKRILDETIVLDVKNGQIYLGLLMCELEVPSPVMLSNAKVDYSSNPNYIRACQFLDSSSKNDLQNLCLTNKINIEKTKKISKNECVVSKLVNEFNRLSQIEVNGEKISIIGVFTSLDYSKQNEEKIISFYKFSKERMERMMEIYRQLSEEEKNNIEYFNEEEFLNAVNLYNQIKEIIISNGLDQEENCSNTEYKEYENDEEYEEDEDDEEYEDDEDDEEYEDDEDDEEYEDDEDDEDDESDEEDVNLKNENLAITSRIKEINQEISTLNYEIGGLGLFNGAKKKELKSKIALLEREKNNLSLNFEIKKCELEIEKQKNIIFNLESNLKVKVEEAKENLDSTPFTAFGRRKELKETYKRLLTEYNFSKKNAQERIDSLNKQIHTLRKRLY